MRFSLRTLLLMFPVIAVLAYGLACAIAFVQVAPERLVQQWIGSDFTMMQLCLMNLKPRRVF